MDISKYNLERLKNCMRRASQGEELTLGFFGGSITQGSLATKPELTYAYRVFEWWEKTFPKATFHYVNGGIGGTTSHYGVSRVVTDLLMYQPDFVVVDFSVNDEPEKFFQETYEGVVRKVLGWETHPAVILLNNIYYDCGKTAQEFHNEIGDYYGIPHVSIKETIYREMKEGKYSLEELTPDGLHPNDFGHGLVAGEIIKVLETVKKASDLSYMDSESERVDETKVENTAEFRACDKSIVQRTVPLTANAYENAKRLTIRECHPVLQGFRADTDEKMGHLDGVKNGWIGKKSGDKLTLEVEASCIAVQYRKTIQRPTYKARLRLDHEKEWILDGNFEENWGDCQYLEAVLHHGERKKHCVEIEILEGQADGMTPFYLMAFIVA